MSENMEQSPQISSLTDDLIISIIARVPISHYPTLSKVSKSFRNLIASPKLHMARSRLGFKEHRVYGVLQKCGTVDFGFYLLHRKLNGYKRFVLVRSPPFMTFNGSYVPVGSKVYAFYRDLTAYSIDCISHTVQRLPDVPQFMWYRDISLYMWDKVVNVVGKKIHVIGGTFYHIEEGLELWMKAVMVFDTETQSWEPPLVNEDMPVCPIWSGSVVMEGKIYLKGYSNRNSIVYEPEGMTWELMDEMLNSKEWEGACVIDNVLYYHDCSANVLWAYDPKENSWSVVNGLEDCLVDKAAQAKRSEAVNYGEKKLALLFHKEHDGKLVIFCAEITLERRQGGGIWGKMESCDVVADEVLDMDKCVSVTV